MSLLYLTHIVFRLNPSQRLLMVFISHVLPLFFSSPELESEPSHFAAQVFRPLLCPVRWQEHPCGCYEQCPPPRGAHAPQVRPEGLHLQEASVQEGEGEGQAHLQRPGLHARLAGWPDDGPGHLQCPDQDPAERLPGEKYEYTAKYKY